MRVLITGGTGFIGSRLALRCLGRGLDTRILAQENTHAESENKRELEDGGAEVVVGSVDDPEALGAALEGVDVVFHLAAAQHEMNIPDETFWRVNEQGTANMLEASSAAGVKRFVHGSTIGVYGAQEGLIDESSPTEPDNIYGVTKLAGERRALEYGDRIPVVVIRIPEVYGPGDRRLVKLFRPVARRRFFTIGRGENLHHLMYVEDLVDALLIAAERPEANGEVILLAGPEPVTTNEMVRAVAAAVGRDPPRLHVPLLPFAALATVLESTLRPLGIQPPLHRRRLDFFRKSFSLSRDRAARVLGFEPRVSFDEGAGLTAEWYRAHGLL